MSDKEGQVYKQFKRLRDLNGSREFMQKLINSLDKNKISIDKARALGYLIKIFNDTVEKADVEKRLEKLEKLLEGRAA